MARVESTLADPSARGMSAAKRAALLAAFGAVVGTLLDRGHVAVGAIAYSKTEFLGEPWWTPIIFGGAALAMGLPIPEIDRALGRRDRFPLSGPRLALAFLAFAAIWMASGPRALPLHGLAVDAALAAAALGVWWTFDRTWQGLAIGAGAAAGGFAVEAWLVSRGAFAHTRPDVLGVASWLPWIYVAGSIAVGNLGRRLARGGP
jgi:hypothetical protein